MNAYGIIGFWAAVMGGVLMYLVAGRELWEAVGELRRRRAPEDPAEPARRRRLEALATAFFGGVVEVGEGAGVALEAGTGRVLRVDLPADAQSALRHLLFQAGRVHAGAYAALSRLSDAGEKRRFQVEVDRRVIGALVEALPGGPWLEVDRRRAEGAEGAVSVDPDPVPWTVTEVATGDREVEARAPRRTDGLDPGEDLLPEAPKRLQEPDANEGQGIFFIRFESVSEWTEDFIQVDRPVEDDGKNETTSNAGMVTSKATVSILGSSEKPEADTAGGGDREIWLPEWDVELGRYKSRYCRATVADAPEATAPGAVGETLRRMDPLVRRLERRLELLALERRRAPRQSTGAEVDLQAYIQMRCDQAAGATLDTSRLYVEMRPDRRPLTLGTLLDLSASTEAPCGERRVVDLERDAVFLLAKAAEKLGDDHAIYGFTSRGARQVRVLRLKGFDEPVRATEGRLAGVGPYANTRMGAAIRVMKEKLGRRPSRHKVLFVITDGKPQDDDGYARGYALADTRRAIEEARAMGIRVVGIGVGGETTAGLTHLFADHWLTVERIEDLPTKLSGLYVRLTLQTR